MDEPSEAPNHPAAGTARIARRRAAPGTLPGPRTRLWGRPLHRRVPVGAATVASLLLHLTLACAWWSGVIAPRVRLAPQQATPALSALHVDPSVVHITQRPLQTTHAIIDDPPDEPQDEPATTLLEEPPLPPNIPDVAWFDTIGDERVAYTIRARRPDAKTSADAEPETTPSPPRTTDPVEEQAPTEKPLAEAEPEPPLVSESRDLPNPVTEEPPAEPPGEASTESAAVQAPRPAPDNRPPRYPSAARRRGWEGRVVMHVAIDAEGAVTEVTVSASSGHALLDQAARQAALHWRFEPARKGQTLVAGETDVSVRFVLDG